MNRTSTGRDAAHALLDSIVQLAPDGVAVGVRAITPDDESSLFPDERRAVARALPARRHEFATGRALLRSLIGRAVAIPAAADRRPQLPPGVVASIAHDRLIVVAALSTDPDVGALGIDVEPVADLEPALAGIVLRADDPALDPITAFVLKEAAYKAWSSLGGRMLEHHDVRLAVDGAEFRATVEPDGRTLSGRYTSAADRVVALVVERTGRRHDAPR